MTRQKVTSGRSEEQQVRSYTIKDPALLAQRQQELLAVATRVFGERGYSNVSVNDIAREAGISIGSLYKYFASKEELLHRIMDSVFSEFECELQSVDMAAPPRKVLEETVRRIVYAADGVKDGIRLMNREFMSLTREHQREFVAREDNELNFIEKIVVSGVAAGEFACNSPRIAAMNILSVVRWWAIVRWPLHGMTREQYADAQTGLVLKMVGADCELS